MRMQIALRRRWTTLQPLRPPTVQDTKPQTVQDTPGLRRMVLAVPGGPASRSARLSPRHSAASVRDASTTVTTPCDWWWSADRAEDGSVSGAGNQLRERRGGPARDRRGGPARVTSSGAARVTSSELCREGGSTRRYSFNHDRHCDEIIRIG